VLCLSGSRIERTHGRLSGSPQKDADVGVRCGHATRGRIWQRGSVYHPGSKGSAATMKALFVCGFTRFLLLLGGASQLPLKRSLYSMAQAGLVLESSPSLSTGVSWLVLEHCVLVIRCTGIVILCPGLAPPSWSFLNHCYIYCDRCYVGSCRRSVDSMEISVALYSQLQRSPYALVRHDLGCVSGK